MAGEKGHPLQRDPALDRAALVHAAHLGADPERANLESVFESIQNEGLADAQVLPFSILAAPEEGAVALRRFAEIEARPRGLSHLGLAHRQEGSAVRLVALFSRRPLLLQPLTRTARPGILTVRGQARGEVEALWVGPCPPDAPCRKGVNRLSVRRRGKVFALELPLKKPGRYVLELLVTQDRGPEVGALWTTAVGVPPGPIQTDPISRSPDTAVGLRSLIEEARSAADLSPLTPSEPLARAAQAHAEAICAARVAAHVLGGQGPQERANAAGYPGPVSENVAIAGRVAQAHTNFLLSPSHRANVLDPLVTELGLGIAVRQGSPGLARAFCVVELYGR
ncbi:MAG: CAP domain-containing protein [Deltaproteobacteria bacterium]|nr:CAP domain-containing protein [Deltaproteobacteria bacterium]